MNEAIQWQRCSRKSADVYQGVKYGHYKAVESKTVRDEREYLNFIWPQEVSEDSREGATPLRRSASRASKVVNRALGWRRGSNSDQPEVRSTVRQPALKFESSIKHSA